MEIFFPTSLDIIQKEKTTNEGFKPLLISNYDLLKTLLMDCQNQINIQMSPTVGKSLIILVRDKEAKENLAYLMPEAKCIVFTIYECKV